MNLPRVMALLWPSFKRPYALSTLATLAPDDHHHSRNSQSLCFSERVFLLIHAVFPHASRWLRDLNVMFQWPELGAHLSR